MQINLKLDGTYPYDKNEGWSRVCWLPREMACSMLGVPHLAENDNGFLNKGYRVVSVDSECTVAVYKHDSTFLLISTDEDLVRERFIRTRPCLIAPSSMAEANERDVKCGSCYVLHNKDKNCPHCSVFAEAL